MLYQCQNLTAHSVKKANFLWPVSLQRPNAARKARRWIVEKKIMLVFQKYRFIVILQNLHRSLNRLLLLSSLKINKIPSQANSKVFLLH